MPKCNHVSTSMEHNLKLTSKEGNEFDYATKYRQLVRSLIYITTSKPKISFVVGIVSRFMQKPCERHWSAIKRVLKYLKGTQDFGLRYYKVDDFNPIGYSDSDFVRDKENGVSTLGYFMSLGSTVVPWRSRKQSVPVDSAREVEYVAVEGIIRRIHTFSCFARSRTQREIPPLQVEH
jgi:hypothetical protein